MAKTLRAADIGYTWLPSIPVGRTFVRLKSGRVILNTRRPVPDGSGWRGGGCWLTEAECEVAGIPVPDFGDRPWDQCILVKGDEPPELPPCPPGEGWIEWSGGERPVPAGVSFKIQTRDGSCAVSGIGEFRWTHIGSDSDIVRYLIIEPPKPKMRPYNAKELESLVGQPLRHKGGVVAVVQRYRPGREDVQMGHSALVDWHSGGLLEEWTHLDGRPCGVEVTDA